MSSVTKRRVRQQAGAALSPGAESSEPFDQEPSISVATNASESRAQAPPVTVAPARDDPPQSAALVQPTDRLALAFHAHGGGVQGVDFARILAGSS